MSLIPRATAYFIAQDSFQKTVLFSQDCCKKGLPQWLRGKKVSAQDGWLKQQKFYLLTLLEAASLRLRWW